MCPKCGAKKLEEDNFCANCGVRVEEEDLHCKKCGNKTNPSEKFCGKCGSKIREETVREQSTDLVGKTKKVEDNKTIKKDQNTIEYFCVSKNKLAVLSVATFGLYEIYWFYKNWKEIKEQGGGKVSPFWRALLSILFSYSLFKRVLTSAKENGYTKDYSSGLLFIIYFFWVNSYRLPGMLWIISFMSFVPLLTVQDAINFINEKINPSACKKGQEFSSGETLLAIIGIIIVLFSIIGSIDS